MDLQNHIYTYLNYCTEQKTLSPKTTKAYRTDLKQFSEFSHNEFTIEYIREYISHIHKEFKPKTGKRKIASLKAFTHYLMVQDIITANPFDKDWSEEHLLDRTEAVQQNVPELPSGYTPSAISHDIFPCIFIARE